MVYLPLASQHLDVKTIGRGGPLQRLLSPIRGRPFLRACQRLPVEVAPQVGMSVRGAAVFLRVGYVAGTVWLTSGYKRDQAMSQLGQTRTLAEIRDNAASPPRADIPLPTVPDQA